MVASGGGLDYATLPTHLACGMLVEVEQSQFSPCPVIPSPICFDLAMAGFALKAVGTDGLRFASHVAPITPPPIQID